MTDIICTKLLVVLVWVFLLIHDGSESTDSDDNNVLIYWEPTPHENYNRVQQYRRIDEHKPLEKENRQLLKEQAEKMRLPFWESVTENKNRKNRRVNWQNKSMQPIRKIANFGNLSTSKYIYFRIKPTQKGSRSYYLRQRLGPIRPQSTNDPDSKSTRMTPMYLMQHDGEEHKKPSKKKHDENAEENFVLSTYSLSQQLDKLLSNFPEANVTQEVLGRTVSYNNIILFKIAQTKSESDAFFRTHDSKYIDDTPEKKIVFIVHALSVMGINTLYNLNVDLFLKKLLSYYLDHLDHFDIFLIPMANPDGYTYVRKDVIENVYWNKNLSPQSACLGVALDRNFDVAWNTKIQVSSCSQHYPGSSPFSEPESRAVRDIFHRYSHKIIAYFHVHGGTYDPVTFKGDAVLYPKGYTDVQSDDDRYIDIKGEIEEAMKNASFKVMSVNVDTLYNWYGKVAGSSVDYASTIYGIPYAMELVMQRYPKPDLPHLNTTLEYYALTEIWGRVIDVIFNHIWKSTVINEA